MIFGSLPFGSAPFGSYLEGGVAVELTATGGQIEIAGGLPTLATGTGQILTATGGIVELEGGLPTLATGTGQILIATGGVVELEGGTPQLVNGTGQILTASPGEIEIVGGDPDALIGSILTADGDEIEIAGGDGTLVAGTGQILTASPGEIEVVGGDPTLTAGANSELTAFGGEILIAAGLATMIIGQVLIASPGGAIEIEGGTPQLVAGTGQILTAGGGVTELEGGTPQLVAGTGQILTAGGAYVEIVGGVATIVIGAVETATGGVVELAGGTPQLVVGTGQILTALPGEIEVAGGPASGTMGAVLQNASGEIEIVGGQPTVIAAQPQILTATGGELEVVGGQPVLDITQGQTLTAIGAALEVVGGQCVLYVDAPYGRRTPPAGDLEALLGDRSAALQWIFIANPYDAEVEAETVMRYSSHGITTRPDATIPNVRIPDRLKDYQFARGFWSANRVFGRSDAGDGVVVLDNEDGGLNSWAGLTTSGERRYHFRWRYAELLLGHETWDYDDFIQMWGGQLEDAQFGTREIVLQLRDRLEQLDKPLQNNLFSGDRELLYSSTTTSVALGTKSFTIPNIVTNGEFTTSVSGWTAGTGWTWVSAVATKASSASSSLEQALLTANGDKYYLRFTVVVLSGSLQLNVEGTAVGDPITVSGTYTREFTAVGSSTDISFTADSSFAGTLDNVVCRLDGSIEVGDIVRAAQTNALTTNWLEGQVLSWDADTGVLQIDATKSGGSASVGNWSLWIRPYEGESEFAGKPKPIAFGTARFVEVIPMGSVQGIFLGVVTDGPSSIFAAYDGTAVLTQVSSFPPASNEVYYDEEQGVLWWATEPTFPLTVTIGATGGTLYTRRMYTSPGSYFVTIPAGVTEADVKLWGAGGGAGDNGYGGAGAFVKGTISVTPGDVLRIDVPGGGKRRTGTTTNPDAGPPLVSSAGGTSAYGQGGQAAYCTDWTASSVGIASWNDFGTKWTGAGGGGAAAILRSPYSAITYILAVAGGGGGASKDHDGGAAGENGDDGGDASTIHGRGATPVSAGPGGITLSSIGRQGTAGNSTPYLGHGGPGISVVFTNWQLGDPCSGGGGGGRRGGGSGASDLLQGGAGGGGSSQAPATAGTIEDGSSTLPGGYTDPEYLPGVGIGGNPLLNSGYGGDGMATITWTATLPAGDQANAADVILELLRDRMGFRFLEIDNTTLSSVTADADTKTFSFGSGNVLALGMDIGDVVSFSGLSANNDFGYTITTLTSTGFTVKEAITTISTPDTSFSMITGDIDGPSFLALDAFSSAPLGDYLDSEISGRDMLDKILATVGAAVYVNRKGLIAFALITSPASTAVASFSDDDIVAISREPVGRPAWRLKIGARRAFRVHEQVELAVSGAQADKDFVRKTWREGISENSGVLARDPGADDLFVESLFDVVADAEAEAARRLPLLSPGRIAFKLELDADVWRLKPGDTVEISSVDQDIAAKNFLVVEIEEEASLDGGRITVLG
jgi:X-X-X-Leu-X-X-Gly heptad repeat protein